MSFIINDIYLWEDSDHVNDLPPYLILSIHPLSNPLNPHEVCWRAEAYLNYLRAAGGVHHEQVARQLKGTLRQATIRANNHT